MNLNSPQTQNLLKQIAQLRVPLFIFIVMTLYIFVMWRVDVLVKAEPDQTQIDSQVSSTSSPKIDQATVDKIRQLQDNSVNVKALFDDARKNPFQD
jgi:hypothetical protein